MSGASPRIEEAAWGRLRVEGLSRPLKDAKLFPGGGREWDWNETGTRHRPGVQVADVQELLDHGADVVVLSRGMEGRLRVPDDTVRALTARGVTVHALPTAEAVELYNELCGSRAVGGLFHSTC